MAKNKEGMEKFEKTGSNTFRVTSESGGSFEGTYDPTKVKLKEDLREDARFHLASKITAKNVMSNADRREAGIPQDDSLEDYDPKFK